MVTDTIQAYITQEKELLTSTRSETVAVVVLNWNGGSEVLTCLKSVFESSHKAIEVILVDNGSIDGSLDIICNEFPQVHWISNLRNLGFAKGSNQGMEWAAKLGIPYVLLLNGDALLHADAIKEMLAVVQRNRDAVVACPRMYQASSDPAAQRLWFAEGKVSLWSGVFSNPAFNESDSLKWAEPRDMEFASGCCMLIPSAVLENVGMLDEAFFAYCEDIDFSLRAREAGFRLRYVPSALLWHGSTSFEPKRKHLAMYRYLSTRNSLWVVRKHGTPLQVMICFCILPFRSLMRVVRMIFRAEWSSISAEIKGIRDGAFGATSSFDYKIPLMW